MRRTLTSSYNENQNHRSGAVLLSAHALMRIHILSFSLSLSLAYLLSFYLSLSRTTFVVMCEQIQAYKITSVDRNWSLHKICSTSGATSVRGHQYAGLTHFE